MACIDHKFLSKSSVRFVGTPGGSDYIDLEDFLQENPSITNVECVDVLPIFPDNNRIVYLSIKESIPNGDTIKTSKDLQLYHLKRCAQMKISRTDLDVHFEDVRLIGELSLRCNRMIMPRDNTATWNGTSFITDCVVVNEPGTGEVPVHTINGRYVTLSLDDIDEDVKLHVVYTTWGNGSGGPEGEIDNCNFHRLKPSPTLIGGSWMDPRFKYRRT